MRKIKTLLIDDEVGALLTLHGMLTEFCPQIQIAGEATSIKDAVRMVAEIEPELVFLDIEMPPFNGFDFIDMTRQYEYGVIFSTAYPQFAVEAINLVQPWAYLIKPYSHDKLIEAVAVAGKKTQEAQAEKSTQELSDHHSIILQDSRKGSIILRVRDILYCKSDGATLEVLAQRNGKNERYIFYHTLKEMETQLPESLFCRVHHSYIINLACVDRYELTRQSRIVYLNNGSAIPISIQKSEHFEQKIEAFLK